MLKGAVENKDTFVGSFHGKKVHRHDLEDPRRPGHLREGLLLEPDEWSAAQHFGLRSVSGKSLGFIEPSRDPREPTASEAPESLRQSLATAQVDFDALSAERHQVVNELGRVEAGIRETTQLAYARRIGENEARQKMSESEATRLAAEERLRELDNFRLPLARKRLSEAQTRLHWWLDDERLRRSGRA